MERSATSGLVITLVVFNIVTGSINTIAAKGQGKVVLDIYDDKDYQSYNHPYFQTMNMFIGEMCCLYAYLYVRYRQRKQYGDKLTEEEQEAVKKGLSLKFNPLWFAIPALFDVVSSTMMYIGLTSVNASVMQILSCTILLWVAIFSYTCLGRRYKLFQYVGLAILFGGVAIVSANSVLNSSSGGENKISGIIILVLSMIFAGLLMVAEEKLLNKFYAHPLQIVGIEGATGLTIYTIALVVMYFIPCDKNPGTCPYGRIEDAPRALMEIFNYGTLLFWVIFTIVSLGLFNFIGVSLTKYASATHRGAVNAVRPFVVWIACLLIGWEKFSWLQLCGYIVAVYGMLLYYGILPLKVWELCAGKKEEEPEATKALTDEASKPTSEQSYNFWISNALRATVLLPLFYWLDPCPSQSVL